MPCTTVGTPPPTCKVGLSSVKLPLGCLGVLLFLFLLLALLLLLLLRCYAAVVAAFMGPLVVLLLVVINTPVSFDLPSAAF